LSTIQQVLFSFQHNPPPASKNIHSWRIFLTI
jgi:hypothetical protein